MFRLNETERTKIFTVAIITVIVCYASLTLQIVMVVLPALAAVQLGFLAALPIPLLSTLITTATVSYVLFRYINELRGVGELAYVDELTGLANRRQFDSKLKIEISRAKRQGVDCAVLYLDLDKFKHINDSYGHEAGDMVIQQFASRIAANLRGEDFVARLAGDEFAAVVTHISSQEDIELVAQRIFASMSKPIRFRSKQIYAGVSIGASVVESGSISADEALRRADFALFQAKEAGRNNLQIFSPDMEERIRNRGKIENDLRDAIANDRFQINYQPLISQSDRKVLGVEAFVRWVHPERGSISPSVFIPVAEQIGLIDKLGNLILHRACIETLALRPIKLAVNVSPVQFMQPSFVPSLREILASTTFEPSRLEIEITEQVFRTDPVRTRETIAKLRAIGVRVALDDFGTGFSSMAYLRDFPLDRIKIDRSFISEIDSSHQSLNLVSHMIELGSSLGLSVTVEGVETADQLALLKSKGLNELQGYLFSHPLTAEELLRFDLTTTLGDTKETPLAPRAPGLRLVG